MHWTGCLVSQTLLVLMSLSSLVSPFLHLTSSKHRRRPAGFLSLAHDPQPDQLFSSNRFPLSPHLNPYYSRQPTVMMAASSPRIGLRSSLVGSGDSCHVDPVRMWIRPPRKYARRCQPTTEISFGCRGGCSSYSRVDVRNTTNLLRSCSCCRPTGFGFRVVKMRCKGFALRTTVKFALGCHCRPCNASVESMDIQRLRDLLRKTSITSIG